MALLRSLGRSQRWNRWFLVFGACFCRCWFSVRPKTGPRGLRGVAIPSCVFGFFEVWCLSPTNKSWPSKTCWNHHLLISPRARLLLEWLRTDSKCWRWKPFLVRFFLSKQMSARYGSETQDLKHSETDDSLVQLSVFVGFLIFSGTKRCRSVPWSGEEVKPSRPGGFGWWVLGRGSEKLDLKSNSKVKKKRNGIGGWPKLYNQLVGVANMKKNMTFYRWRCQEIRRNSGSEVKIDHQPSEPVGTVRGPRRMDQYRPWPYRQKEKDSVISTTHCSEMEMTEVSVSIAEKTSVW